MNRQRSIFDRPGRQVRVGDRLIDKGIVFDFLMGRLGRWRAPKAARKPMPMAARKVMTGKSLPAA